MNFIISKNISAVVHGLLGASMYFWLIWYDIGQFTLNKFWFLWFTRFYTIKDKQANMRPDIFLYPVDIKNLKNWILCILWYTYFFTVLKMGFILKYKHLTLFHLLVKYDDVCCCTGLIELNYNFVKIHTLHVCIMFIHVLLLVHSSRISPTPSDTKW